MIRLFGPLAIENGERTIGPAELGGVRPKQVLEILVTARGHRVPIDRLAELVWGDERPQNVPGSLQTFVSTLRRHLTSDRERARELVVTESEAYRFATERVSLDLDRFDELLERSAHEPTHRARVSLEQALDLVRGEVLEDEPYATWALDVRGSYQGRVLGARLDVADAALAELDFAPALAHAEAAAALDRFSERAYRTGMLALYALGRPHEALSRYREFRIRLDQELGLEPGGETRALESAILRQEDVHSLLPRPTGRSRAEIGSSGSTVRLLGREAELDALAEGVRQGLDDAVFLHVEGDAGLGKSRLLDELTRRLDGARIGRASCSQLEQHLPYVPIAAGLRQAFDGVELDVQRVPALGQILPELAPDLPGRRFDEVEILEALVSVVAEDGPIVLVLDDLQWADASTLAALAYLRRRGAGLGVAIVTAALPPEPTSENPLRRLAPDTIIRLEPLTPAEVAPLGIDDLHETTGGHPRVIADVVSNGRPASPSRTLAEALLNQCRAEGPQAFRILAAASVLDQPFDPEPLAELLATDPTELTEELERLCERRILRVDGLRFRFRYDLVRQVLRETVSPARQRLMRQRLDHQHIAIGFRTGAQAG
ncbi:MAG: BTAD domain-containing putative transcriptional regulator [Verrucomicrobiota bacterium]